jgi:hypothetical protein
VKWLKYPWAHWSDQTVKTDVPVVEPNHLGPPLSLTCSHLPLFALATESLPLSSHRLGRLRPSPASLLRTNDSMSFNLHSYPTISLDCVFSNLNRSLTGSRVLVRSSSSTPMTSPVFLGLWASPGFRQPLLHGYWQVRVEYSPMGCSLFRLCFVSGDGELCSFANKVSTSPPSLSLLHLLLSLFLQFLQLAHSI